VKTISYFIFVMAVMINSLNVRTAAQAPEVAPTPAAKAYQPASEVAGKTQRLGTQQQGNQQGSMVTPSQSNPVSVPPAGPSTPSALAIPAASMLYVLQPSDVVQISVYREPDLTSVVRLAADGSITFPLIGRVVLSNLTVQQAQDLLVRKLGDDYLVNPQVMLVVMEYTKQHFTILGEVQKPGAYDLPVEGKLSILQAVGLAGGFTRIASPSRIVVKRKMKNKKETVIKINATKMANKTSDEEFLVQEGDAITVPESYF